MPLLEKLRDFLEANLAEYSHTVHPTAYTAREVATAEHLPAREIAKTVVILGDGGFRMLVVPANRLVDFREVRTALGLSNVRMATEYELGNLFPDCEVGAMPPVGSLYGLPVFIDASLLSEEVIAFNAGTHRDEVHMRTAEYKRLVQPTVVSLARAEVAHNW